MCVEKERLVPVCCMKLKPSSTFESVMRLSERNWHMICLPDGQGVNYHAPQRVHCWEYWRQSNHYTNFGAIESSLGAPVVLWEISFFSDLTTSGATNDDKIRTMTTLGFQDSADHLLLFYLCVICAITDIRPARRVELRSTTFAMPSNK